MTAAEQAVQAAAAQLPDELRERLTGAETLSGGDRQTLIDLAGRALTGFQAPTVPSVPGGAARAPDVPDTAARGKPTEASPP
jgi:F-type H+-transporting ATPase subunit alpha